MNASRPIGIGILGLGTVGSGVAQALDNQRDYLSFNVGAPFVICKILVRDVNKPRFVPFTDNILTTDFAEILDDSRIQIIVELMGGEKPAEEYIRAALGSGKSVVTANKEVMAKYGSELLALATSNGLSLHFEGAVGGAIPIVGPLTKDLLGNEIHSIHAIINGTTNFILTMMADDEMTAEDALKLAQELGYAEADPSNDVEGVDAAYKIAILASLAFHSPISSEDVFRDGIVGLHARDFRYARELGYAIKLLAIAKFGIDGVELRVHPALVPESHLLAKVNGVFNAIEVEGTLSGRTVFHGLGAGRDPTTSAVLGDLVEIGRRLLVKGGLPNMVGFRRKLPVKPMADITTRYYFRLNVPDRAGVLAQITRILGELGISIASITQKDSNPTTQIAELVIITHPAKESSVQQSLALLEDLDVVKEISNMIRVEELPS